MAREVVCSGAAGWVGLQHSRGVQPQSLGGFGCCVSVVWGTFGRGGLPALDSDHMPEGIECSEAQKGLGACVIWVFEGER